MGIREDFDSMFVAPSFYEMYVHLNSKYKELDFTDEISDSERIAEYKWIAGQFNKYISKQQSVILQHGTREKMMLEVESLIEKTQEYGDTRKAIVYNIVRDDWLHNFYELLAVYDSGEDEDEEEDNA
jgi:hypothetical protein